MKKALLLPLAVCLLLLTGCETRSISNSGYRDSYHFRGELSELAVLGVDSARQINEEDIQSAINGTGSIQLKNGDRVMLIQSGAQFPDEDMVNAMGKHYTVLPFSGVPERSSYSFDRSVKAEEEPSLDMAFRLAAAKGGASTLVVYWGVLESARKGYATKTVSWVPIVGSVIPDEKQEMRIRLKVAVIDVASGHWEMLTPEVYSDEQVSNMMSRRQNDQEQVALLKSLAYERAVKDLQLRYGM